MSSKHKRHFVPWIFRKTERLVEAQRKISVLHRSGRSEGTFRGKNRQKQFPSPGPSFSESFPLTVYQRQHHPRNKRNRKTSDAIYFAPERFENECRVPQNYGLYWTETYRYELKNLSYGNKRCYALHRFTLYRFLLWPFIISSIFFSVIPFLCHAAVNCFAVFLHIIKSNFELIFRSNHRS